MLMYIILSANNKVSRDVLLGYLSQMIVCVIISEYQTPDGKHEHNGGNCNKEQGK